MAYAEKRVSTAKGSKGKVTWRARYLKPDGTWGSESGFPTKKTALAWGDGQETAIREGRWVDPDKARTTLGAWAPVWMDAQAVDPNTASQRRRDLNRFLLPGFGTVALSEINLFTAKAWANQQTAARSSVDKALTLLSMMLTGAADAGYILANPMAGRRRHTGRGRKAAPKEKVFAQPEEVTRIAERMTPVNGLMVISDAWLGPRWGELAGLHRDNALVKKDDGRVVMRIDPEVGTLHEVEFELTEAELVEWDRREAERLTNAAAKGRVAKARKRPTTTVRVYLGPPKNTTSAREVDLPPFLVGLWREHLKTWTHDYVFVGPRGGFHRRGNFGDRHLRPAADGREAYPGRQGHPAREAWEPVLPGFTMRAARGTADTWMKEDGVDRALRFATMGWATDDIEGVYERITPMMRKTRLDALQARWDRARVGTRWEH